MRLMRFTVVGHSCLYLETEAGSILVDPWLSGSCYWRTWWHFPPSAEPSPEMLSPDFVYLTHHHFDHFHYPSMRRLDRSARVFVPEFGVDVMANEVRGLGFEDVVELPNGLVTELGSGVRVASYQYGFDDTALVVADGDDVVADLNDCKIRGRALRRVRAEFGRPTFVLKSWSFAQSYPIAYTADDPDDLQLVSRQSYLDDFVGRIQELEPRYAVPFGSMMALLHPDAREFNEDFIPPGDAVAAWEAASGSVSTDTVALAMAPGDTWSSDDGFEVADVDWYSDRETHLEELAVQIQPKLDDQAQLEAGRTLDFDVFSAYLGEFVRALPPLSGRFAVRRPIVFFVGSSEPEPFWIVDVPRRRVERAAEPPSDAADLIWVPEAILADAIERRVLHMIHGSMRIHTELRAGGASADLAFWGLLMIWEIGYLSRRAVLSRRFARTLWRRRAEALDAVGALWGRGTFLEKMSDRFAETSSGRDRGG